MVDNEVLKSIVRHYRKHRETVKKMDMLELLIVIFILMWFGGFLFFGGGLIHLLLAIVVILIIIRLIRGERI